ncbi:site-2 protease family protein, partial [Actinotalea sp. C106]|uniref:site-2 protease family protein n=1 Tax=Actinotalea sp. C106 TaxID=2908644 RepID=UPI0020296B6A
SSALVAVAGPAVNLGLGLAAWLVVQVLPSGGLAALIMTAAAVANGFVGVFNLVPGLPLDGGRVLEALVWRTTGRRSTGTVVAGWVGRVVAVAVLAWVLLVPLVAGRTPSLTSVVWGALIGAFLWSGADQAVRAGHADRAVEALALRHLMRPTAVVSADATLADVEIPGEAVILGTDGRPGAYLDADAVRSVPASRRAGTPLSAVAVPLPPGSSVDGSLTGSAAVQAVALAARSSPVMVVLDPTGRVVGLLHAQDVVDALRRGRAART